MSSSILPEPVLLSYLKKYQMDADKAQKSGNTALAAENLRKAAATLMKVAEIKVGTVKSATIARANGLLAIAQTLSDSPAPTVFSSGAPQSRNDSNSHNNEASSKPDSGEKKEEKKQRAADETETLWEAVDVPDISFDDVAGLDSVKEAVMTQFIYPRRHKEIYQKLGATVGGGILMYGPPGTGKTLMAKAIAHEVGAKFYQVKCSDIVSKWFGEAERNIKNLFETARKDKESVIFFDEFESLAAKRGGDNNVMSRLVPELLAQMQGFNESDGTILFMAATNRPWDIDSAFLRPGRFNDLLYIPLPDAPARLYMVNKLFKKTPINSDIELDKFASYTEGFNGADVENFCNKIKQNAAKRVINQKLEEVIVVSEDVESACNEIRSSVSQDDIALIKKFEKDMKRD